jgi:MFS family permease
MTGRLADSKGRKPILLFGFVFLPVRALLCAVTANPFWLVAYQLFDGLAAGIFGIVGVLMIADLSRGSGNYNLALGTVGAAVGVGAAISTSMAGFLTSQFGFSAGFLSLAVCGLAALLVLWLLMPETKEDVPASASDLRDAQGGSAGNERASVIRGFHQNEQSQKERSR